MKAIKGVFVTSLLVPLVVGCGGNGDDGPADTGVGDKFQGENGVEEAIQTDVEIPQDPGDTSGGEVVVDVPDGDAGEAPGQFVITPPDPFTEAFTIHIAPSSTVGQVGGTIEVATRVGRGTPEGAVGWEVDAGDGVSITMGVDGFDVKLEKVGRHAIEVVATDAAGNVTRDGILLTAFLEPPLPVGDVDGDGTVEAADVKLLGDYLDGVGDLTGDQFDRADVDLDRRLTEADRLLVDGTVSGGKTSLHMLAPASGAPGRKLLIADESLMDISTAFTVRIGTAEPVVPMRSLPGYATVVIPPDAAGQRGEVDLTIESNGQAMTTFKLDLLDMPPASDVPGDKIVKVMEELDLVLGYMPAAVKAYLKAMGVEGDEAAVLLGMLDVATDSFSANRKAFLDTFAQMEPEGRAAFEQVARANDLDELLIRLADARVALQQMEKDGVFEKRLTVGQAAVIIDILCTALDVADISGKVAEINEIAGGYLSWFDWWPLNTLPVVGQVISFLRAINNAIGAITDIIGTVAEYLPEFGPIKIDVAPKLLQLGASAKVDPLLQIVIATKLCLKAGAGAVDGIMERLNEMLTKRLAASIPLVSGAFKAAKYNADKMSWVVGLIYKAIGAIAEKILDATGVQAVLEKLVDKVCGLLKDPWLPLDPSFVQASCGSAAGGTWTCSQACIGAVTVQGQTEICHEKKSANNGLACEGCNPNNCTGCCDQENCLSYAQQSDAKCGSGGTPCSACPEMFTCQQGNCVCTSTCLNEGDKQCAGTTAVEVCTKIADNPPCLVWKKSETCENGNTCLDGECQGGCNATNCNGCCLSDGTCIDPPTNDNCGKNGSTCGYCLDKQCIDGECKGVTVCCMDSASGVYSEAEDYCGDGKSKVSDGPCGDVCCPTSKGFGDVVPFAQCAGGALAPDKCELMCLGKLPVSWSVKYDWAAGGTGFGKQGPDPIGNYSGDCYGLGQFLTVSAGGAPNTYVAQAMAGCFSGNPSDPTAPCIYCDKCPSASAVNLTQENPNWWSGPCGGYKVTLKAGCP